MRRAAIGVAGIVTAVLAVAGPAAAQTVGAQQFPVLVHDVKTGAYTLGNTTGDNSDMQNLVQPDTQAEPSIAVNPANPLNVVAAYQEGRRANGGDATNGYATSFDGGATWMSGELPKLTTQIKPQGVFERASDAVAAFGPDNTVYVNSLIFDQDTSNGLRSGMAVNVSKDGGKTWSDPVVFQDDRLGGANDKNWIVVDNSDAPGHHKGRVYVVWDRIAPVVYDYCDQNCDQQSNWLPDFQTLDPVLFPGQGIGAYPLVTKSGALAIVLDTTTAGIPTGGDEPEPNGSENAVVVTAPNAGSTPYPSPLAFLPPIQISPNTSNGQTAQRGTDGLPAAAVDPKSGALYVTWDDGRFRTDSKNDAVFSKSTDEGQTWSRAARINQDSKSDKINHYGVGVAVSEDGVVHVSWRQRDESGKAPLFTDQIDTYYSESRDGGKTWSAPLQVNTQPSMPWFGAFSRDGTFEGDYDQLASAGGSTYIVREQGVQLDPGETQPLQPNGKDTVGL